MSTKMGSSRWICASGSVCPLLTRADGEQRSADAARDGGGDGGELQVDARGFQGGAGLCDLCGGLARAGLGVGVILLRDRFDLRQRAVAFGQRTGGLGIGLCALQIGGGLVGGGAIEAGSIS